MLIFINIIKISLKSIWSFKLRSFLTILGIIIGISSTVMIISIGAGAQSLIINEINELGTDKIAVLPGANDGSGPPAAILGIQITTLTLSDYEYLRYRMTDDIIAGSPFVIGTGRISRKDYVEDISFNGVSDEYLEVERADIAKGRFFSEQDVKGSPKIAVLGADIADDLFNGSNPIGRTFKLEKNLFTVIGVLEKKSSKSLGSLDRIVLIPMRTAQKSIKGINFINGMRLQVRDVSLAPDIEEQIKVALRDRHSSIVKKDGSDDDFTVQTAAQALDLFESLTNALKYFLAGIAAISLLVGGIGIMNIMLVVVNKKIREIGIRKAVGAHTYHIMLQFIIETMIIALLGGIIGLLIGIGISYTVALVAQYMDYKWSFIVPMYSIYLGTGISGLIGLVFGIYPSLKAAKYNPIEALRYE